MARLKKWGKKPGGNWFSVVQAACGLYSVTTEPGIMRVESGGAGLFDQAVAFPQQMAHIIHYPFRTLYDVNTANVWTEVASGGTALTVLDKRGGFARITNQPGTDDAYRYYVGRAEICSVRPGKHAWFFTTIEIADVDSADLFVGLCSKVSGANALFDSRVNSIGFYMTGGVTASSVLYAECRRAGTAEQLSTNFALTDNAEVCIGFHIVSDEKVLFFVGNSPKTLQCKASIGALRMPTTNLAVAFGIRNYGAIPTQLLNISAIKVLMDI